MGFYQQFYSYLELNMKPIPGNGKSAPSWWFNSILESSHWVNTTIQPLLQSQLKSARLHLLQCFVSVFEQLNKPHYNLHTDEDRRWVGAWSLACFPTRVTRVNVVKVLRRRCRSGYLELLAHTNDR